MPHGRVTSPRVELLAEVVALGIPTSVALILSNLSNLQRVIGLGIVLAVAALAKYFVVYRPRVSYRNRKLTTFLDDHLRLLITDIRSRYEMEYDIRANVMRPQRTASITKRDGVWTPIYEKYLTIAYCAWGGPDMDVVAHAEGDVDETQTKWSIRSPPEGNCGRAFVGEGVRVASRDPEEDEWRGHETTPDQDSATKEINTVLSIPVRKPNGDEPVAVLNIDASVPVAQTPFRDEEIQQEIAEVYAEPIGILL